MVAPADLAEFRLLRAVRAGQPGAFPAVWNAQVGSIWSVTRALFASDAEALGWVTTFRVELGQHAHEMDPEHPLRTQVGAFLHRHLRSALTDGPLPPGPIPPTEAGLRQIPPAARLPYLLDLFFDVPEADVASAGGESAVTSLRAVARLMEPGADTDARLFTHAALMRTPPAEALFLPAPAGVPEPRPRWPWLAAGATAILILTFSGGARDLFFPATWDALGTLHAETLGAERVVLQSDPAALAVELSRARVPSTLAEVPALDPVGFALLGARVVHEPDVAVVFLYQSGTALWTLQHHDRGVPASGPVEVSADGLDVHRVGEIAVVGWEERGTLWVLGAAAPGEDVLTAAARIRQFRASGAGPGAMVGGGMTEAPGLQ